MGLDSFMLCEDLRLCSHLLPLRPSNISHQATVKSSPSVTRGPAAPFAAACVLVVSKGNAEQELYGAFCPGCQCQNPKDYAEGDGNGLVVTTKLETADTVLYSKKWWGGIQLHFLDLKVCQLSAFCSCWCSLVSW